MRDYAEVLQILDAKVLATYRSDYYAGMPAVTVKETGSGSAYYVAARLDDAAMTKLLGQLLEKAGITTYQLPEGVEHCTREADGKVFDFYLNCAEKPVDVDVVSGTEILTGQEVSGTYHLETYGVCVISRK